MAKVKLYNASGEFKSDIELTDAVFGVKAKKDLVHQVYVALTANQRIPWADSKDRSEVSGGGKKPWKQKGTGRARHGSIRSPIWKGGGVTFGPMSIRNYSQKINKKMAVLAVKMCLSDKTRDGKLVVLENLPTTGKTKQMAEVMGKLPGFGRTTLILSPEKNDNVVRAVKNLSKTKILRTQDANVMDLLDNQFVVTTEAGIKALASRLK
ncbi:MAG: 50S ribosomal protein L4 [Patescibacteria group bacterium]